ncbi:twitching motility protein PilT [Priestia megaterium]|nr:twitching motility protein PilT [Priestia megaterium]
MAKEWNELDELLSQMIESGASDLHLKHASKIAFRIDGDIEKVGPIIHGDEIYDLSLNALSSEQQRKFLEYGSVDFSYQIDKTRFRGVLTHQRREPHCVIRRINDTIVPIDETGLPQRIKDIAESNWGMLWVTGPTGSGKTTLLASIIDYINATKKCHIYTIEEPLEFIHRDKKAFVSHREVGIDTPSFALGLRDSLRNDPDVILVGEMRDHETIATAMTASETGHVVLGTLHTTNAPQSVNRVVDVFDAAEHHKVRSQIAANLRGVITQRLFKNPKGGRTAVQEIMFVDDAVRDIIRAGGSPNLIYEAMRKSNIEGTKFMEDSIRLAKKQGLIYDSVKW